MEWREKERERNIDVWLPLTCPLLGTQPTTQACALTGDQTSDPLVHRAALNPPSHTSQGSTPTVSSESLYQRASDHHPDYLQQGSANTRSV